MATYSASQRAALVASIAEGARTVKYEDREVEYRSISDMLALLHAMDKDLGNSSKAPRQRRVLTQTSKGLGAVPPSAGDFGS